MIKVIQVKQLEIYVASDREAPFVTWVESLHEVTRNRVKERLDRVSLGNLGDWKSLGEGTFELRLDFGPGYRIYFGQMNHIIVLLCGGDKASQNKDIKKAQHYWQDYLRMIIHENNPLPRLFN